MAESFNLPGLSLPFILTLYIFIIFLSNYNNLHLHHIKVMNTGMFASLPQLIKNYFNSLSFIFSAEHHFGIILAAGLLFFSRVLFLLSISSFLICMLFVKLIIPSSMILMHNIWIQCHPYGVCSWRKSYHTFREKFPSC